MIASLFRRKPQRGEPRVPDGQRVYAVGDIHGRLDLLDRLIAAMRVDVMESDAHTVTWVFMGDYVDRGPRTREVVDRLLSIQGGEIETVFLKGNHEDALLNFLDAPETVWGDWRRFGGLETLMSYDIERTLLAGPKTDAQAIRDDFRRKMPGAHFAFFTELKLSHAIGDYYFVHAGARPGIALDRQAPHDKMWIRDEFLGDPDPGFDKVVVHGHTPCQKPERTTARIGIDTGAYFTGKLTAAVFEGTTVRFLQT